GTVQDVRGSGVEGPRLLAAVAGRSGGVSRPLRLRAFPVGVSVGGVGIFGSASARALVVGGSRRGYRRDLAFPAFCRVAADGVGFAADRLEEGGALRSCAAVRFAGIAVGLERIDFGTGFSPERGSAFSRME